LANQVRKANCRRKDRIALKGDENAGRFPASALDFGMPPGDGADRACRSSLQCYLSPARRGRTLPRSTFRESSIGFNGKSE
jgi:hypothetical protein